MNSFDNIHFSEVQNRIIRSVFNQLLPLQFLMIIIFLREFIKN